MQKKFFETALFLGLLLVSMAVSPSSGLTTSAYETTPYLPLGETAGNFTDMVSHYYRFNTSYDYVYLFEVFFTGNPYAYVKVMKMDNTTIFSKAPVTNNVTATLRGYNETLVVLVSGVVAQGSFRLLVTAYSSANLYFPSRTYSDRIEVGRIYRYNVTTYTNSSGYVLPTSQIGVNDTFELQLISPLRSLGWGENLTDLFSLNTTADVALGEDAINIFVAPLKYIREDYAYAEYGTYLYDNYVEFLSRSSIFNLTGNSVAHRSSYNYGGYFEFYVRWDSYGFQTLTVDFDPKSGLMKRFNFDFTGTVVTIELVDESIYSQISEVTFSSSLKEGDSFVWEITNFESDGTLEYATSDFADGDLVWMNVTDNRRVFYPYERYEITQTFSVSFEGGSGNPFTYSHFIIPESVTLFNGTVLDQPEAVRYFNEYYYQGFTYPVLSVTVSDYNITVEYEDLVIFSTVTYDRLTGVMTSIHISAIDDRTFTMDIVPFSPQNTTTTGNTTTSVSSTTETTTSSSTGLNTSSSPDTSSSLVTSPSTSPLSTVTGLPFAIFSALFAVVAVPSLRRRHE